jgi:hypothetical protein
MRRTNNRWLIGAWAAIVIVAGCVGCGGGSSSSPPPLPTPTITSVAVSPSTVSLLVKARSNLLQTFRVREPSMLLLLGL